MAMTEGLTLTTERVDDMPLWLAQRERMGLQPLWDEPVATHGHWVGLSLGWVSVGWLTPVLCKADPRLNHVKPWTAPRRHTLREGTGQPGHPLDVSDDRLAAVLEALSDEPRWRACEGALNHHVRRVYARPPAGGRRERTTASGHWTVTQDGLFPCGPSTDQRPDLPPVKVMVSALEPLGMPVATDVVPGPRADAPWYVPAITRPRAGLGRCGRLSGGDGQMGALETRAFIQTGGDYSWCPWSETHLPLAVLGDYLAPVWTGAQAVPVIERPHSGGPPERLAAGVARLESVTAAGAGQPPHGLERRGLIRSVQLAQAAARGLRGRRRGPDPRALREAVDAMLARFRVPGLGHVRYQERCWERPRRRNGHRDATVRLAWDGQVTVSLDQEAVDVAVRQLGWRVDVTPQPAEPLALQEAVWAYRREYLVERAMGRLKGRPLSLTPMALARADHAPGVIRLLSSGGRGLTLLECVIRWRLATARTGLAGLYAGTPKRATARPTTERLLARVEGLPLTIIREGRRRRSHRTPLSRMQRRLLARLNVPGDVSMRLCPESHQPP